MTKQCMCKGEAQQEPLKWFITEDMQRLVTPATQDRP